MAIRVICLKAPKGMGYFSGRSTAKKHNEKIVRKNLTIKIVKNPRDASKGRNPSTFNPQPATCAAARAVSCRRQWRKQAGQGPMRHRVQ